MVNSACFMSCCAILVLVYSQMRSSDIFRHLCWHQAAEDGISRIASELDQCSIQPSDGRRSLQALAVSLAYHHSEMSAKKQLSEGT